MTTPVCLSRAGSRPHQAPNAPALTARPPLPTVRPGASARTPWQGCGFGLRRSRSLHRGGDSALLGVAPRKAVPQPQPQPALPAAAPAEADAPAATVGRAAQPRSRRNPAAAPRPKGRPRADALDEFLATGALEPPPLEVHLQKLGHAIEAAGASATHPRELYEQPDFERAIGAAGGGRRRVRHRGALCARPRLGARLRGARSAQPAPGWRAGARPGPGPVQPAGPVGDVLCARLSDRPPPAAAARRPGGGRQGPLARHAGAPGLLPRIFREPRRGCGRLRQCAALAGRLPHPLHQGFPGARRPSARDRLDRPARDRPEGQYRPRLPDLVRPVLGRPEKRANPGRARQLERSAGDRAVHPAAGPGPLAPGERRAAGRQDRVPAAPGQAGRRLALERVRGERRRSHGRPDVVRPARGPGAPGGGRDHGAEKAHLVCARPDPARPQRHPSGPERQHSRSNPSRHHGRPAGDLDRSEPHRHRPPAADAPGAAQHPRGHSARAAIGRHHLHAGTRGGEPGSPTSCT